MQRSAFAAVVLITVGLMGFFALVVLQPEAFAALLGRQTAGHISEHFRKPEHRVHDLTFSLLLGAALVGILAQTRAPMKNTAGQLMALIPFAALLVTVALTNTSVVSIPWVALGALTLLAAVLHPSGGALFRSFSFGQANRVLLVPLAIAALPLLAFAATNVELQRTLGDEHVMLGHYGYMAAFSLTIVGVGLVASLASNGWRLAAGVAGCLPILLGLSSLIFSDAPSRLEVPWAVASIAWGLVFLLAAQRTTERQESGFRKPPTPAAGDALSAFPTPFPVTLVAAVVVVLLAIVLIVLHLSGGGFPGHAPAVMGHVLQPAA